jgi:hypothetical protein
MLGRKHVGSGTLLLGIHHEMHMHGPVKLVSYVIVAAMAGAVLYAFYISVTYWTGIGV